MGRNHPAHVLDLLCQESLAHHKRHRAAKDWMRLDLVCLHNLTTCDSAQPGTSTHDPTFSAKGALPLLPMKAYPSAAALSNYLMWLY